MTTSTSGILAGCCNDRVWVRIEGKGSHQNSRELKAFLLSQIESTRGQRVVVDLSLCTGMDSTFMGMLACLNGKLEEAGSGLHIINAGGRNGELLRGLGLDEIFPVEEGCGCFSGTNPECAPIAASGCSKQERTEICLESHEALVAADERNAPKFRDVIDLMRNKCAMAH